MDLFFSGWLIDNVIEPKLDENDLMGETTQSAMAVVDWMLYVPQFVKLIQLSIFFFFRMHSIGSCLLAVWWVWAMSERFYQDTFVGLTQKYHVVFTGNKSAE